MKIAFAHPDFISQNTKINEKVEAGIDYHDLSEHEKLVADANMYIGGAYVDNEFDNLDKWCEDTAPGEYGDAPEDIVKVKTKIGEMIKQNIITIIVG